MFDHILVPLDGSTGAEHAITVAARIARVSHGSITLLQAVRVAMTLGRDVAHSLLLKERRSRHRGQYG